MRMLCTFAIVGLVAYLISIGNRLDNETKAIIKEAERIVEEARRV